MVLGQGSLFSSRPLHPPPPPTPTLLPFIPLPIHLSCSNHFRQLSLNPANHRLGWSVGNQTRPWLDSTPNCTVLKELFTQAFTPCKHTSKPPVFGAPVEWLQYWFLMLKISVCNPYTQHQLAKGSPATNNCVATHTSSMRWCMYIPTHPLALTGTASSPF